jgi:SAM-dependent methyltransferase
VTSDRIVVVEANCPLCASDRRTLLFDDVVDVEDRVEGLYAIGRCSDCATVYLSLRPSAETLSLTYPPTYHVQDPARRNPIARSLYDLRLKLRSQWLRRAIGANSGAVLEVGCGDGSLMKALAREMPAESVLTGIDLMVTPTDASARPRLIRGEFEKTDFPAAYDAVIMFNVLEHLASPLGCLERVRRTLRSGGLFIGEVPNWGSPWRKLFPRHWQGLQVPRHQTFFDRSSLRKLLDAAGFDVVSEESIFDPGDVSVTLCNWVADTLQLQTLPRKAWFFLPSTVLGAPLAWLVNAISRDSGAIGFVGRKR